MSRFLTELETKLKNDDTVWVLTAPLVYESNILGEITVPKGFETDFASVPRIPIFYALYGGKAHRESVLHDALYRSNSIPKATRLQADRVFLEAMKARGKPCHIRWPMFLGVRLGGWWVYYKRRLMDKL